METVNVSPASLRQLSEYLSGQLKGMVALNRYLTSCRQKLPEAVEDDGINECSNLLSEAVEYITESLENMAEQITNLNNYADALTQARDVMYHG